MISDKELMQAVGNIVQRSEKQQEIENLFRSYVDIGVLQQVNNLNNQVVYGRRGTGKTHLFKVLQFELEQDRKHDVLYLDMRTLGSSSQFLDRSLPIPTRCSCLFRDILNEIYNSLTSHALTHPPLDPGSAYSALDSFSAAIEKPVPSAIPTALAQERKTSSNSESQIKGTVGEKGVSLGGGQNTVDATSETVTTQYQLSTEYKVLFPELAIVTREVLDRMAITFYLLLDEWSSVPEELQPYLAELLRRAFFPHANFSVKIAALEYKTRLKGEAEGMGEIGIELGGDISANLDLDDYFAFDRNPKEVADSASNILYNHISLEIDKQYLEKTLQLTSVVEFRKGCFTSEETFVEVARASEGIPRDLINIFSKAYFAGIKSRREKIDIKSVREAARQWYEQDKHQTLPTDLAKVLSSIQQNVIGDHKSKYFMLLRDYERDPIIQRLFDARVIHLVRRGYADKSNPGTRYNVYTLDYGTYVDLQNTSLMTQDFLLRPDDMDEVSVPAQDLRKVRRTILDSSLLKSLAKL